MMTHRPFPRRKLILQFSRFLAGLVVLAGLGLSLVPPVMAQEVTAAITGRVTDPSGAVIPGATVTATDQNRGTVWPTQTNPEGFYNLPRLPIGTYNLKVEAQGFQIYVQNDIPLQLNQIARINVALKVGAVTQTVEVSGEAPILHTDSMQVGLVTNSLTNTELPLATRNFVQLTLLTPGVVVTDPSSLMNGVRTGGGGRPYVNGNRKEANNFLLSGIDNNLVSDNLTAYQPSVDAIQEFNMITNNAPAEFGNFQGGVINVEIKSGTNNYHGVAFEFLRNDKLNAVNWARNWNTGIPQDLKRPAMRWNIFGGTFGGPIIKDKLFFFGDIQAQRLRFPPGAPSSVTVFTAAERNGDFSQLLNENGIQLYNPCASFSGPCQPLAAGATRQPFNNNIIPVSMINPVAANLFTSSLYPAPLNNNLQYNQLDSNSSSRNTTQFDIRMDAKPTAKSSYFGRFSMSNQHQPGFHTFPLYFDSFNDAPFRGAVFDYTRAFSPSFVNDAKIGFNRVTLHNGALDNGLGNIAQDLGIQDGNDRGPGLMALQFSGGLVSGIGNANIGTQQKFVTNEFEFVDTVILTRGRHIIKTGFQWIRQQLNCFYAGNNGRTGIIQFNGQFTALPNAPAGQNTGIAEADFFLGLPTDVRRGVNTGTWGHRGNVIGAFVQDDWRATDHLTLNLGLRWEDHTPWVEVFNRQTNFAPFTGTEYVAGQGNCPYSNCDALYNSFNKDFQPRIGFAWTPAFLGGKTVLRGAYTISSFLEGTGTNLRLTLNPPFNTEFENNYAALSFPSSTTDEGMTALIPKSLYSGALIRLWDPNVRPANVQQWNFTVERQFPGQMLLSVGYVGQHGLHLMVPMPYFQRRLVGEAGCTAADAVNYQGSSTLTCASPYLAGNPMLADISQISGTESNGAQRYDGLQAGLTKRYSQGLQFQISYTYSKTMTNNIGYYGEGGQAGTSGWYFQNAFDKRAEWGRSYFDATQNFVGSYIYELPIGKDKKFGQSLHPVANTILGDWQLSGILSFHGGFPETIYARDNSGTFIRSSARANCIGPGAGSRAVGPGVTWINTSAFVQPASGFGNCANGTTEGPGLGEFDLGIQKEFHVTEAKRFEFRAEFINLTNSPVFNAFDRNVYSANFGQVRGSQGERNIQFGLKFYF